MEKAAVKADLKLPAVESARGSGSPVLPVLVVFAIAVRVLFVLLARNIGNPHSMDAQNYLNIAHGILSGQGFALKGQPTTFVAPLYPALLALLQAVLGKSILAIKLFQAVFGGLTTWMVYLLAKMYFPRGVAYVAAGLFALHPEMVGITHFIYTEVLFIFLLVTFLVVLAKALKTHKLSLFLLAGILLGITNLCRGTLLYFPFFLFGMLVFYRTDIKKRLLEFALLTLAMALVILPWTVRNYVQFHAFVPVATGAGDVFWTGNYLPYDGEYRYEKTRQRIKELVNGASLVERDRILMREAKKSILAHPLATAWLTVRKAFRFWFRVYENIPSGKQRQTRWMILLPLAVVHFFLLGFAGVGLTRVEFRDILVGLILALLLYYTLIHAVTLAVPRYRQPLIPEICIFAAAGLLYAVRRIYPGVGLPGMQDQ